MALICAISNEVPEVAVVSPSSGAVFEKRIIEKYIIENGVDPLSGKELRVEDLIEIKTPPIVKPKPPSATSIPATLKAMQDEWDALMLHTFTQRQQLQTARQELSHALYQHDAACRVIARLTKEVTALTQERKRRGRTVPEGLVSPDQIRAFLTLASHPGLHSASVPGILSLDINPSDHSKLLTGGNDRNATVFNKDTEQVVAILKGHTKKVTRVIYHPDEDTVITASPDHTIRVWNVPTSQTSVILRSHDGPVTGLSLHPTGDYLLSTSTDQHWAFSDIRTGALLSKVSDSSGVSLTTAQFHPDGLIFGTGTENSQVKIWDLKEQSNVANFPGHVGPVTSISFSENGYYLATAAEDACVKLWDLRKLKNFKTIQLEEGYAIKELCFDQSGTYLAIAGTDVRVYLCRQWQELKVFNDHTASATGVRFGKNAQYIASTSMDRTLKLYGIE
ncbi:pre-mRNA-processing factor 19 isoform X2 [Hyposmocoma kahamanoa]|uniref:pre-mRNA-processing factor 19 isoform X2 n=1 Tax=Hyposmocoma kahamanoa TaxID=1477025 RepID=UPI000E6D7877|nr:pre-mRNA-processing factor 19 isoform X2 [Hyposmocoma kahamanoa]